MGKGNVKIYKKKGKGEMEKKKGLATGCGAGWGHTTTRRSRGEWLQWGGIRKPA